MIKRMDRALGRMWIRLDRVLFADYPRLDNLLCTNWFTPLLLVAVLGFLLLMMLFA